MAPSSILFVMALAEEGVSLPPGSQCLITGIGKINAAMKLAKYLSNHADTVQQVINLGSAGGVGLSKGQCFLVNQTVQFDMDVSPLGFARFETPFDALDDQVAVDSDALSHLGLPKLRASPVTGSLREKPYRQHLPWWTWRPMPWPKPVPISAFHLLQSSTSRTRPTRTQAKIGAIN